MTFHCRLMRKNNVGNEYLLDSVHLLFPDMPIVVFMVNCS